MLRTFLVSFLILLWVHALPQHSRQYSFNHFSITNGLSSNFVNKVVQDKEGYIWLATTNGLQRYDGSGFITFKSKTSDPASIPSNKVLLLYIDQKDRLWIVTDNDKVGIFDTRKFTYNDIPIEGQKEQLFIVQGFQELPTGELVLLKSDNLFLRFDPQKNRFVQEKGLIPHPEGWKRRWVTWDTIAKKYWIACDSGLVQYDPKTRHLNYRGHNVDNDPVIKAFEQQRVPMTPFVDKAGNVIYQHWPPMWGNPYIHKYNRKTGKAEKLWVGHLGYHEIGYFFQQRNGRLWVYGMPFLAEWTDKPDAPFVHVRNEFINEHSIKFDYLHDIFEDREQNLWLATDNGLYYFNPDAQIFNTYYVVRPDGKPPFEAPVQAVQELKDGRIFVGCWGSGSVTCYDREFNPIPLPEPFPKDGDFSNWDMAEHPKTGDLWMTMQGGSIVILNARTNKFKRVSPEVFGKSTIRQVDEDTTGNLWFGTQNGKVVKWDFKKSGGDPSKGYELVLQTGMVHKIHYDYQGYIWIATLGHGLIKMDAKTHKVVKVFRANGPEGERLYTDSPGDMTYYDDSTLLVTAGCINIVNTKTNKISFITTEDGLPSHTAESIEKDESGIVWIGLTNGICRLNLQKRLITYYDRRDGIIDDEFSMGGAKELSDGRLVFFTDHNFMVFDPIKFGQQSLPPKPHITSFKLEGKPLSVDSLMTNQRVVLPYHKTSIAINFSALSYLQQRKIYYYRMEGVDKEWIRTDQPSEVVYNHLEPGQYTFRVRSGNADGMINEDEVALIITVRPPFWNTWWFYCLLALLLISVLYLLDRERMNRIRSLQQVRRQIRLNLRDEVSETLNNITVLSEIAKIKADKNVAQAKDFIDQISEKSRYMMQAMDDTLWSIDPQNDSMRRTLLRIRELTDGIRAAHLVEIDLIVDNKVQELELDMKVRHEFYFYYKEAIECIVQNLHCGQIFVNIKKQRSRLMVEILVECDETQLKSFEDDFASAVQKRVSAMPASIDILTDANSFSALLFVDIR